jgi:hypothetical protein
MAIAICVESIRLGPGSLSAPGPGLIALGCGMSLGILGLILFARTFKSGAKRREVVWEQGILWKKLVFALASLIGYAFSLDILGFRLVTLLWMGFICRFGKIGWKMTVFISIITTLSCYILFTYLGIRFPHGVLGF